MRVVPCCVLAAVTISAGCTDLGTCQMDAAKTVVYAGDGTPYYAGQALVQSSCAEGVCHSVYAQNANRNGVPFGLNFDVAPLSASSEEASIAALREGITQVRDHATGLWGEVEAGTMPPGELGMRPDRVWNIKDASGNAVASPLKNIHSDQEKATVRNWLSCGAPVVAGVTGAEGKVGGLGDVVAPLENMSTDAPTFDMVYASVFQTCTGCHNPTVVKLGLDFTSAQTAFATLVDQAPFAGGGEGKCGSVTQKLVTPGKCQESLVYLKLTATPPCGDRMPPGQTVSDASMKLLCDWIDAGAKQ
jgi:hypothetical protein